MSKASKKLAILENKGIEKTEENCNGSESNK